MHITGLHASSRLSGRRGLAEHVANVLFDDLLSLLRL